MNAFTRLTFAAVLAFGAATTALAQEHGHGAHAGHGAQKAGAAAEMVDGEIKKVDTATGKITIRHGELKNLSMPAMTMAFRVKDPATLGQVKVGDKVKFMAEKLNGAFTVVHLENVK